MLFADASAPIAVVAGEPEAADPIEVDRVRLCSAFAVWKTVAGLCCSYAFSVPAAREHVRRFLGAGNFQFVAIGEREFETACDAYVQYGKGRHPAILNMGDCYAYACAKAYRAKLLFKGIDFTMTDVLPASLVE
jgi:ribonuclease VapC